MDWQATELNNSWRYAFMALVRRSVMHSDQAAIDASIASWNDHMRIVEKQLLDTGAYIAGETFTLADIVIGLSVNRWFMTPIQRPELQAVSAYYDLLDRRAAYKAHGRNGTP